jgi:hypothetical protein
MIVEIWIFKMFQSLIIDTLDGIYFATYTIQFFK